MVVGSGDDDGGGDDGNNGTGGASDNGGDDREGDSHDDGNDGTIDTMVVTMQSKHVTYMIKSSCHSHNIGRQLEFILLIPTTA
jgi:hypothetical protein